jgi:hypothetical protein
VGPVAEMPESQESRAEDDKDNCKQDLRSHMLPFG